MALNLKRWCSSLRGEGWDTPAPLCSAAHLRVEPDVGTHGVQHHLLGDGALGADPEGEPHAAPEAPGGHHLNGLHHLRHWPPVGGHTLALRLRPPPGSAAITQGGQGGLAPGLEVVVHHVPGVPVQRHVVKHHKLVAMAAVREGLSVNVECRGGQ